MVFVMTGACATTGGVAAVNVQILRALTSLVEAGNLELTVLSFVETQAARPPFLPEATEYHAFEGRKLRLAASILGRSASRPIFFFDYVRLALPLLPLIPVGWGRTIVFAHGREYWQDMRWTDRLTLRAASLVLTNSHFTLRKMHSALGDVRAVACPLGLPHQLSLSDRIPCDPAESLELPDCAGVKRQLGQKVLLLVGRMDSREREKGHDAMLAVLPELLNRFPDVQLAFAGPGDDRDRLAQVASRLGVGHAVFISGRVESHTLAALYRRCYAFTMPSRQEGFGLVYLEAMNFAKPCLGCWDDGAEEVIRHKQTGYLIRDPGDSGELATVLSEISWPRLARAPWMRS
jgi:glycosyltransferase involved in cell wall biosynthesis